MRVTYHNGERNGAGRNPSARPDCIVIGLGNPILGDDGVGWKVVQELQHRLNQDGAQPTIHIPISIEFDYLSLGGLSLMERLIGFRRSLIIDAISSGSEPIGTISRSLIQDFDSSGLGHVNSIHDTSLFSAVQIGQSLNVELPDKIVIITVEIQPAFMFKEKLSEAVGEAIPRAADLALNVLAEFSSQLGEPNQLRRKNSCMPR